MAIMSIPILMFVDPCYLVFSVSTFGLFWEQTLSFMANLHLLMLFSAAMTIFAEIILVPLLILSPFIFVSGVLLAGPPFLYAVFHPYWFE